MTAQARLAEVLRADEEQRAVQVLLLLAAAQHFAGGGYRKPKGREEDEGVCELWGCRDESERSGAAAGGAEEADCAERAAIGRVLRRGRGRGRGRGAQAGVGARAGERGRCGGGRASAAVVVAVGVLSVIRGAGGRRWRRCSR
jgi:hypothetical protein